MISRDVEDSLKKELVGLFGHLSMMRRELASLHSADSANFDAMTDTLDAIVENTEAASNTILESVGPRRGRHRPGAGSRCSRQGFGPFAWPAKS